MKSRKAGRFHIKTRRYTRILRILSAFSLLLQASVAVIAAETLDDSLSPRKTVNVQLQWQHQGKVSNLSRKEMMSLTGRASEVEVRLNTSAYVGKTGRIFLVLPVQIDGLIGSDGLRLSWQTRGFFTAGTTTPGNRALIFEGTIDAPVLTDFFSFTIDLDAGRLNGNLRYAPIYQIETD